MNTSLAPRIWKNKFQKRANLSIIASLFLAATSVASAQEAYNWTDGNKKLVIHFGNPYFTEGAQITSSGLTFALPGYAGATITFKSNSNQAFFTKAGESYSGVTVSTPLGQEDEWTSAFEYSTPGCSNPLNAGGIYMGNLGEFEISFTGISEPISYIQGTVSGSNGHTSYSAHSSNGYNYITNINETLTFRVDYIDPAWARPGVVWGGLEINLANAHTVPEPSVIMSIGISGALLLLLHRRR